ncbi:MAG: hypothetical protein JNJ73_02630 [Hyphomonadaceae bacterium]|nr:hypothetical protein [Hyphomonadaceae bacterium]
MKAKEAIQEAKAAKGRIGRAIAVILGARVTAGVACLLLIAFGMALVQNPQRLPPLGNVASLVAVGLPPLEFGKEKEIFSEAVGAAKRQGGVEKAQSFFANPMVAMITNWVGLAAAIFVLGWGVRAQSLQWRRGIRPF